jgi:hypothetical protein
MSLNGVDKKEPHGSFLIENNGRLKEIIIRILKDDIERSLWIDNRLERTWMWWKRQDLISDKNEQVLSEVISKILKLN